MGLTFRMHTKEDEEALIQLWSDHSGWDQLDVEAWSSRLLDPPLGSARIVVAEDDKTHEIVGQFAFIPSMVSVKGREVTALRPFAPIMATEHRGNLLPIIGMYRHAVGALRSRGDGMIYMMPDPRWVPLFRRFPGFLAGSFPLWSHKLPLPQPFDLPEGYIAGPNPGWGERVDRLWAKASQLHDCLVVRDTRSLPWKIGSGDYQVTAIQREGELVGLVASKQKGDRQWLICDLLAVDAGAALEATLKAACNVGHYRAVIAPEDRPIHKVAVLTTSVFEPVVQRLGFYRDEYDFPMVVQPLDRSLDKRDVAPERWYVSAND